LFDEDTISRGPFLPNKANGRNDRSIRELSVRAGLHSFFYCRNHAVGVSVIHFANARVTGTSCTRHCIFIVIYNGKWWTCGLHPWSETRKQGGSTDCSALSSRPDMGHGMTNVLVFGRVQCCSIQLADAFFRNESKSCNEINLRVSNKQSSGVHRRQCNRFGLFAKTKPTREMAAAVAV